MGGPGEVVSEVLEGGRLRERLLALNARGIGQAVGELVAAFSGGRTVHLLAVERCAHLARYLADVLCRAAPQRVLASRFLDPLEDGPDGLARAVDAFVQEGDVVLALALESNAALERALGRARVRRAASIAILTESAAQLLRPDTPLLVPQARPLPAAESFLALGHVLQGLIQDGLEVEAEAAAEPAPPPAPASPARSGAQARPVESVPRFASGAHDRAGAPAPPPEVPTFASGASERPAGPGPSSSTPRPNREERRRSARFAVRDAWVRWDRGAYPGRDQYHEPYLLEDLSLTGLRFVGGAAPLELGDTLWMSLELPAYPEPLRLRGQVRRIVPRHEGETRAWAVGVRFQPLEPDVEQQLHRLLAEDTLRSARRR